MTTNQLLQAIVARRGTGFVWRLMCGDQQLDSGFKARYDDARRAAQEAKRAEIGNNGSPFSSMNRVRSHKKGRPEPFNPRDGRRQGLRAKTSPRAS